MRSFLLENYPTLAPLSHSTIHRWIHRSLNLSFRKMASKPPIASSPEYEAHTREAATLLTALMTFNVEIIFVDEFHVGRRNPPRYSWVRKGA
jgi:hypothetical protein